MAYINGKKVISKIVYKSIEGVTDNTDNITINEGFNKDYILVDKKDAHLTVEKPASIDINNSAYIIVDSEDADVNIEINSGRVSAENLAAENIVKGVSILGVTGTFEGGSSGGHEQEDSLITGTITSYTNDRITKVRDYAFGWSSNIEYVSLPNVTTLGSSAFFRCQAKIINIPKVISINNAALKGCKYLENLELLEINTIYLQYIDECTSLKTIKLAVAEKMQGSCKKNTALTDIYLGYNGLVILSSADAFASTITGLKIHVRSEYADQYATATNWSSLITAGTVVIVGDYNEV